MYLWDTCIQGVIKWKEKNNVFKIILVSLSFIIFSWKKDSNSDEAINICKALYKIIDPEVSEDTIRNNLIEIGAMDEEINYADYKGYYPKKNVRFAIEEKDGILKLYINDEAMGYWF